MLPADALANKFGETGLCDHRVPLNRFCGQCAGRPTCGHPAYLAIGDDGTCLDCNLGGKA
jgi:hypothetical protein